MSNRIYRYHRKLRNFTQNLEIHGFSGEKKLFYHYLNRRVRSSEGRNTRKCARESKACIFIKNFGKKLNLPAQMRNVP